MNRYGPRRPIISVSRRTDIPAFYGEWFINRVRAGWAVSCNPFNRRARRVSLLASAVAGFVFWSKNFRPFLRYLDELDAGGYPIYEYEKKHREWATSLL